LIFQTLDDKKECVAVYYEEKLWKDEIPSGALATWSYAAYLEDPNIEYASLYCLGETLEDACPAEHQAKYQTIANKLKAFLTSFREAEVDLTENCFFDLVPERFLLEFCEIKNKITEHVLDNYEKPENYSFLLSLTKMLHDIKYRKLNIDLGNLKDELGSYKARQFFKKAQSLDPFVSYDICGTKTGRLTTKKDSFPILTLDKSFRKVLKPQNDYFVELDFNAAELRTLLALSGKEQPPGDIHEWNAKNVYGNETSREEAKKRIFAWLYNPDSRDRLSSGVYNRDAVVQKYYSEGQVKTFFDRIISSDDHHALNYIVQSTTSDLFLRQATKIYEALSNTKSKIAFCVHDSLVIDYSFEQNSLLKDLIETFSETELGKFKVNVSVGSNFGELRKIR
jgi:hypothetical protein